MTMQYDAALGGEDDDLLMQVGDYLILKRPFIWVL